MSHEAEHPEGTMRSTIRRAALAALTTITLSLVLPLAAFADNAITVDCGDGSPLTTTVATSHVRSSLPTGEGVG